MLVYSAAQKILLNGKRELRITHEGVISLFQKGIEAAVVFQLTFKFVYLQSID